MVSAVLGVVGQVRQRSHRTIGIALLMLPVLSQAQSLPAELLRQNDRSIQEIQQQSAPNADVFIPDDAVLVPPTGKAGQEPCQQIREIRLEGHPDAMGDRPVELLSEYTRCLSASDINQLLGRLNRWYQEHGWITTRVYAVPADLNRGELILKVVPGRIRRYRSHDDSDQHDRKFASAFPKGQGEYLNLRDLEQGLENINRLPSQEAKFKLYPGEEPGTSDIVVEVAQKPSWRVNTLVNNSGTQQMGLWRNNTEFALDNLVGMNDQLVMGYNRNLDGGQYNATFEGYTLNYFIPQGHHNFGVGASTYTSAFHLPGINQNYVMRSRTTIGSLLYDYALARTQASKHHLLAGMEFTAQNNWIGDTEIESQYRRLSVPYLGIKGKQYVGNQVYDWLLRVDQGTGLFGAMGNIPGGADPRYTLGKAQLGAMLPIVTTDSSAIMWRSNINLQVADQLPSIVQMYVGSRYNVRGFTNNSLYGSTGGWIRNDLDMPSLSWSGFMVAPYLGLDAGYIKPNDTQAVSKHTLVGSVAGIRGSYKNLSLEVAYTRALVRPEQFASEAVNQALVQIALTI